MQYQFYGVGNHGQRPPDNAESIDTTQTASLHDALEDLLSTVWACEREWNFDNRIALAVRGVNR